MGFPPLRKGETRASDRGLPGLGNGCPCLGKGVPVPGKRLSYTRKRATRVSEKGVTDTRKRLIRPSYQGYPSHANGVTRPSDNGRPVPRQRCIASLGKGAPPSLRDGVPRPRVLGYIYPHLGKNTPDGKGSHTLYMSVFLIVQGVFPLETAWSVWEGAKSTETRAASLWKGDQSTRQAV